MGKKFARPMANGRNKAPMDRFTRIGHRMQSSPAYRSLNSNARNLLLELAMLDNGGNNGSLWLSVRDAAKRMGVVDLNAARQAFEDLEEAGFIRMTVNSFFEVKSASKSRARCWRLTWVPVTGVCGATDEWKNYVPSQSPKMKRATLGRQALDSYRKASAENRLPVLDFNTLRAIMASEMPRKPIAVLDSNTALTRNCGKIGNDNVLDSNTHTAVAIGSGLNGLGWWQRDAEVRALSRLAYCNQLLHDNGGIFGLHKNGARSFAKGL